MCQRQLKNIVKFELFLLQKSHEINKRCAEMTYRKETAAQVKWFPLSGLQFRLFLTVLLNDKMFMDINVSLKVIVIWDVVVSLIIIKSVPHSLYFVSKRPIIRVAPASLPLIHMHQCTQGTLKQ